MDSAAKESDLMDVHSVLTAYMLVFKILMLEVPGAKAKIRNYLATPGLIPSSTPAEMRTAQIVREELERLAK